MIFRLSTDVMIVRCFSVFSQYGVAPMRFRLFLGARSLVPFPSFVDEFDKASSMQTEAKAARQFLTVISRVTPNILQPGGGARADGGASAGDDVDGGSDEDDDDGSARGSKAKNKEKAKGLRKSQQANRPLLLRCILFWTFTCTVHAAMLPLRPRTHGWSAWHYELLRTHDAHPHGTQRTDGR